VIERTTKADPVAEDGFVVGVATPLAVDEELVRSLRYDSAGLVAAVVQDRASKDVLMVGWMNEEAVRRTLATGRSWFWSRSRQEYWCKGETSGDRQWVRAVWFDCDRDALLVVVDQEGRGACHRGIWSCFAEPLGRAAAASETGAMPENSSKGR
jgi:phosphoribosyl-AMP cyclohydrolase